MARLASGKQDHEGDGRRRPYLMAGFNITTVDPGVLNTEGLRTDILSALNRTIGHARDQLRRTTQHWEHKVTFNTKRRFPRKGTVLGFELTTEDAVWNMLDQGTSVRFSDLSPDWESKTTPNQFDSGFGAGEVIGVSFEGFKPGIEARNWSELLAEYIAPILAEEVDEAINNYLARNNWTL